jgi:hypothetical protein
MSPQCTVIHSYPCRDLFAQVLNRFHAPFTIDFISIRDDDEVLQHRAILSRVLHLLLNEE